MRKISSPVLVVTLASATIATIGLVERNGMPLIGGSSAAEIKGINLPASTPAQATLPQSALFDHLGKEADVVYLVANSSLVFGPDPHGRSEEITFLGPVTVPKWPMSGYGRRVLADGRQQIDIELTQSELTGESYALHGPVVLGEHPDLRSLGTITERPSTERSSAAPMAVAQMSLQNKQAGQVAQGPATTPPATSQPPAAPPSTQVVTDARKVVRDTYDTLAAPNLLGTEKSTKFQDAQTRIQSVIDQLTQLQGSVPETEVVPADFVVERKVLMTTAKGILYNETAVPVRGRIDSIPPVRLEGAPTGVNVFRGMELPIPLLDKDGNINGWFYSKSHMAFAVLPKAIERSFVHGKIELKSGARSETVEISGPAEIHHLSEFDSGKAKIEVMMLALRGRSDLLGGDIMISETFSDRDHFSRGELVSSGDDSKASLDLFIDLMTPSAKLTTHDPLPVVGDMSGTQRVTGQLQKGRLNLVLVGAGGRLETTNARTLYDEVERPAVEVTKMQIDLKSL